MKRIINRAAWLSLLVMLLTLIICVYIGVMWLFVKVAFSPIWNPLAIGFCILAAFLVLVAAITDDGPKGPPPYPAKPAPTKSPPLRRLSRDVANDSLVEDHMAGRL